MTCSRQQRTATQPDLEAGTPWFVFRDANHCASPPSFVSSPEPKAHQVSLKYSLDPALVRHPQFQTSSPKPLGQLCQILCGASIARGKKSLFTASGSRPRWPPCSYMVKTLQKSSPEQVDRFPRNLVCCIAESRPS